MRVVIVGGGKVGTFIASELVGAGHDVTVLEQDPDRCQHVLEGHSSTGAARAEWRNADGCEVDSLVAARTDAADVVIAVTGDDIKKALLTGGSPATPDDLRKRFESFMNERCKGKDATKLRFGVE